MIDEEYLGEISTDKLEEGVYAGLIYGLGDVYSRYYTKDEYEQESVTTEGLMWVSELPCRNIQRWCTDQ